MSYLHSTGGPTVPAPAAPSSGLRPGPPSAGPRGPPSAPISMSLIQPSLLDQRTDLITLMREAEGAERYHDMAVLGRALLIAAGGVPTRTERNLFAIAHKQVIAAKRAALRALGSMPTVEENEDDAAAARSPLVAQQQQQAAAGPAPTSRRAARAYRRAVADDVRATCHDAVAFVNQHVLDVPGGPNGAPGGGLSASSRVFFHKFVADHLRYIAELCPLSGPNAPPSPAATAAAATATNAIATARGEYERAAAIAAQALAPTDPARLGVALNLSVLLHELAGDVRGACDMAKLAFDAAINRLDELDEEDYRDATLIMQLMRDNLALWVTLQQGGQGH